MSRGSENIKKAIKKNTKYKDGLTTQQRRAKKRKALPWYLR